MPRLLRPLAVLACALSLAACDSGGTFDVSPYVGDYTGTRVVTEAGVSDTETITVRLTSTEGGAVTLTLFPASGGVPEVLRGEARSDGFVLRVNQTNASYEIEVDASGAATGDGFVDSGSFRGTISISGRFTGDQIDLTFVLAPTSGGTEPVTTRISVARE